MGDIQPTASQELREAAELLRAAVPSSFDAAVADLLEAEAESADRLADGGMVPRAPIRAALKVARTYMGTEPADA